MALRFYGDELDPEAISTRLGALPSRSAVKGQRLPSASGRERVAKTSYWHLQSDAVAPDEEFEDHVRRLPASPGSGGKSTARAKNAMDHIFISASFYSGACQADAVAALPPKSSCNEAPI